MNNLPRLDCSRGGCDAKIRPTPAQAARSAAGRPVFCSRSCQQLGKTREVKCAGCGIPFRAHLSRIAASKTGRLFHSQKCGADAGYKPRTGRWANCENPACGTRLWIKPSEVRKRFCSTECHNAAQSAGQVEIRCANPLCGEVFRRPPSQGGRKWHSRACYDAHRYAQAQGHRKINQGGYAVIRVGDKYLLEHRVLAAEALGRELLSHEEVHHLNGDRADNWTDGPFLLDEHGRLKSGNLDLWSTSQPAGQEIGPKLEWAERMLVQYGQYDLDALRRVLGRRGTAEERERYAGR